jgi:hypothetical protein
MSRAGIQTTPYFMNLITQGGVKPSPHGDPCCFEALQSETGRGRSKKVNWCRFLSFDLMAMEVKKVVGVPI